MADPEPQNISEPVPQCVVVCRAGNPSCPSPLTTGCDVCCAEPSFCRHCSCILCGSLVGSSLGGFGFIRCVAAADQQFCGHVSHVQCAIASGLAGTALSQSLDVEYCCRRCDQRTDLVPHIYSMIRACQASGTEEDVLVLLDLGLGLLRGSKSFALMCWTVGMESALSKLKNGWPLNEVWDLEDKRTSPPTDKIVNVEIQETFSADKEVTVKISEVANKEVLLEPQETLSADKEVADMEVDVHNRSSTEREATGAMECDSEQNYMSSEKSSGKIKKILDRRCMRTRRGYYNQYLVEWQEKPISTWVSEAELCKIDPDLLKS